MKKFFLFLIFIFTSTILFSQEVIEMQDVSTTITNSNQQLEENSLPDFKDILPIPEELLPELETQLPNVETEQDATSNIEENSEDFIYFEGQIGGGFPSLFMGDFSLSHSDKNNYFNFDFFHETINGFGLQESNKGFFKNDTNLKVDGTVNFNQNLSLDYLGDYTNYQFGLQNLSPNFYSTNLQQGNIKLNLDFLCSDSLQLYGNFDSGFSSWFASYVPSQENLELKSDVLRFELSPRLGLLGNAGIFSCLFEGGYDLFSSKGTVDSILHRGNLLYYMDFTFEKLKLISDIGLVFVNKEIFVPFSVGLDYIGKVEFSLLGGMRSFSTDVFYLEQNPIIYDDVQVSEQTQWFANFDFMFPVGEFCQNNISLDFSMPTGKNNLILPDYSKLNEQTGLYGFSEFNLPILTSEYSILFYFENSQIDLSWNAWWLELPENLGIAPHEFSLLYSFVPTKNNWGFSVWSSMNFGGNREILGDIIPDVGLSFYVRSAKSFKFSFELNDMIKLFTGTQRTLYGDYIKNSPSASVFVSFNL